MKWWSLFLAAQVSWATSGSLKNGSPLELELDAAMPREWVVLAFEGGARQIEEKKQGSIAVLMGLLAEGPADTSVVEFKKSLFQLGVDLAFEVNARAFYVILKVPPRNLEAALAQVKKTLLSPKLDAESAQRLRTRTLSQVQSTYESLRKVLFHQALRDTYLKNPLVWDGDPSPASVLAVDLESLRSSMTLLLQWSTLRVYAAGPLSLKEAKKSLAFSEVPYKKSVFQATLEPVVPAKTQVQLIDWPEASEVQLLYVFPAKLGACGASRASALIAHQILGGGISGWLNQDLRVNKGLTYHAASRADSYLNHWSIWTFGDVKNLKALLTRSREVVEEFKKHKLTSSEVDEAKQKQIAELKQEIELPKDAMTYRMNQTLMGCKQPLTVNALSRVSLSDVQKFIQNSLDTQVGYLELVGNASKIKPILKTIGFAAEDIKEMTADQVW